MQINDTTYNLHKEILESKSSFFEAMFRFQDLQGVKEYQLQLPYEKNVIDKVLEHIYECNTKDTHKGFIYPMYRCMKYLGILDANTFLERALQILPSAYQLDRSHIVIDCTTIRNVDTFNKVMYRLLTSIVGVTKDKISIDVLHCKVEFIGPEWSNFNLGLSFGNPTIIQFDPHDKIKVQLIGLVKYILDNVCQ